MNNIRDKFEAWLSNYELQPNAELREEELELMLDAWQAATEQSQKEIAEKDARIAELEIYADTYANEAGINLTARRKCERKVLKIEKNILELQAREKVLVEALQEIIIDDDSENYVCEKIAKKALANVRGEVK